ncbi:hypothetical protein QUB05_32890 [Microcoleus sp. F10-C6]|uniref:hypothetical protein n=1 Tax=unclassified Microcoleus TaxID=2642155 RepID=UPI002FD36FC4
MINVKIAVPVYKRDQWGDFDRKANIEIAADGEIFSETYVFLRTQIDELLQQSGAENQMLLKLHDLEKHISRREKTLQSLDIKIEIATRQLQKLQNFLERLGIDPGSYSLLICDKPIGLKSASEVVTTEIENDPIPFNCSDDDDDNPHEF